MIVGYIGPRTGFEKVFPNTLVSYRKNADGAGCNMPAADAKAKGEFVHDEHLDEHATCFNVRDGNVRRRIVAADVECCEMSVV